MISFKEMTGLWRARSFWKPDGKTDEKTEGKKMCGGNCSNCPCGCSLKEKFMTLDQAHVGDVLSISGVKEGSEKLVHLMELGLLPGMEIILREKAPFGGPILVYVLGTILAIRESEASQITVKVENKGKEVLS